ncbi:hypothetical protein Hanom_Chr00s014854g01753541 [Helianthus anomalus]
MDKKGNQTCGLITSQPLVPPSLLLHVFITIFSSAPLPRHVLPDATDIILYIVDVAFDSSNPEVCVVGEVVGVPGAHEVFLQKIM